MITVLKGWVTTARFAKRVGFIHITDGIYFGTTQIVVPEQLIPELKGKVGIGTSIKAVGELVESPGAEQAYELVASSIEIIGECDPTSYPIQKKDATYEYFRTISHLRPRTAVFQSVFRVRSALSAAIHQFFQERDFMWVHTPIITAADCEGAGEMFRVATPYGDPMKHHLDDSEFFGRSVGLTVSGQLEVEAFAEAFTKVYTFGPTFRAEHSNTARHASEFWMIEPEIAFAELKDVMALAEDFIKSTVRMVLRRCSKDVEYLREKTGAEGSLLDIIRQPFAVVTHDEAQQILVDSGREFEFPVGPGASLQAEHEKYLAGEHFQRPVFITHYPREQKAFYMRVSDDGRTVEAFDLIVPQIGEIIGGSQREERLDKLQEQMQLWDIPTEDLEWYLDLRRFGSVPHGGFGLGLERMLLWMTGMKNIRDVIPYPRTAGQLY